MGDKRTFVLPSLLFGILFLLIAITGYFQIRIIQRNIESLLRSEGEIIYNHIKREIDLNLEYLNLLEKSPSIITPNFLNIMAYDETIIDNLYSLFRSMDKVDPGRVPLSNYVVIGKDGKTIIEKGSVKVPRAYMRKLQSGAERGSFLKIPSGSENSLTMGIKMDNYVVFFTMDEKELDGFRRKLTVREVVESEEKRFNIVGINIYDSAGTLYIDSNEKISKAFVISKPLDSKYLPGFTIEILLSKKLAQDTVKRTTMNFVLILVLLGIAGSASAYAIFLLERRHAKRVRGFEKELEMKERLVSLGKLASGMAHEIRNPLNAMSISIQRLKREFAPVDEKKEEYYQFLDITRSELSRIDRIVEEFLLSTKSNVPFADEKLYNIIHEVAIILREKAVLKGVDIVVRVDGDLAIPCQKDRLKQAFYNIILNGIEAIDKAGRVEISSLVKDGYTEISIKDTGAGIEEAEIEKMFDYYYTTKDKGIGLGLPISYMIIKDHGGDIKASSEPDKGTTFLISLPTRRAA
jgi:signal transduction histidine kinase